MTTIQPSHAPSQHSSDSVLTRVGLTQLAVLTALLLLAYWGPVRHLLVARWMADGNWSHGPLIPLFSLYFLWLRMDDLKKMRARPSYLGAIVLAGSLSLYFVSMLWLRQGYPQGVSIVGAVFGLALLLGGWPLIRITWFPILFLLLAVPLPESLYVKLTMPLRQLAATVAATVMPMFVAGLHTEAQAVVIDYIVPGRAPATLNVEEACSGMRLMMAFVTLGLVMSYLGERPWWQRMVLVASCLPIAVFCNAVRVTTTGLFMVTGHEELARGTPHQLLGILMLVLAFSLFAGLRYVLGHLLVEESAEDEGAIVAS